MYNVKRTQQKQTTMNAVCGCTEHTTGKNQRKFLDAEWKRGPVIANAECCMFSSLLCDQTYQGCTRASPCSLCPSAWDIQRFPHVRAMHAHNSKLAHV